LRCCSTLVLWSPADDAPWSSADRWYQLRVGERMTSTDWMISQSGTVRIYITAHTAVQAPCQDGVTNAAVLTPGPAPDSMLVCTLHTHVEQAIYCPNEPRL
jgi:hypothetical protein